VVKHIIIEAILPSLKILSDKNTDKNERTKNSIHFVWNEPVE